ncbi:hypothetical protein [Streptomyces sp. NBC_00893]|uniref:hypothetical protein n=1 Tax=Streptomyces sp. NBC_00893 TaxID=2975862 RepID=UPI0022538047|nr:hypothetical protein [Streptomyces sp. NBC_00893]MCX4848728.1 hypothetical protein [Streptomyces sp. NBC_00893]
MKVKPTTALRDEPKASSRTVRGTSRTNPESLVPSTLPGEFPLGTDYVIVVSCWSIR